MGDHVKPLHLVTAVLTLFAAMWAMIEVHAASPHSAAVHRNEIELLRELMQTEHEALRREIQSIKELVNTQ